MLFSSYIHKSIPYKKSNIHIQAFGLSLPCLICRYYDWSCLDHLFFILATKEKVLLLHIKLKLETES